MFKWLKGLFSKKKQNTKRKKVIALLSEDRCGKSELADFLTHHLDILKLKIHERELFNFGDDLKYSYVKLTGCTIEELNDCKNGIKKCRYHKIHGNCREGIINYSIIKKKQYGKDFFTKKTIKRILKSNKDFLIIADLRFLTEVNLLKENFDVNIVKVISDLDTCGKNKEKYELDFIEHDTILHIKKIEELTIEKYIKMLDVNELYKVINF